MLEADWADSSYGTFAVGAGVGVGVKRRVRGVGVGRDERVRMEERLGDERMW